MRVLSLLGLLFVTACDSPPASAPVEGAEFDELNKQLLFDQDTSELVLSDNGSTLRVDLSSLASGGVTAVALDGTDLVVSAADDFSVDLSSLAAPQEMSFDAATRALTLSDGGTVQLPPPQELSYDETSRTLSLSDASPIVLGAQSLTLDAANRLLSLSQGGSVQLPTQTLALASRELSISGGNAVQLPAQTLGFDPVTSALSLSEGNSVALPLFKRTFIVSPGATPEDGGQALRDLCAALELDSDPAAIYLEPGDYAVPPVDTVQRNDNLGIGVDDLPLPGNVVIAGAGVGVTTVTTTSGVGRLFTTGDGITLRHLNLGSAAVVVGHRDLRLEDVVIVRSTALESGSGNVSLILESSALVGKVVVNGAQDRVDVRRSSIDGGAFLGPGATIEGSTLTSSDTDEALICNGCDVRNSILRGQDLAVLSNAGLRMVNTEVDGGRSIVGARCLNVFDEDLTLLGPTCQ